MTVSRVFWGAFFVVTGVLLLLAKLNILTVGLGSLWKFWPIVLVLWGIGMLTGGKQIRLWLALAAALLLALIIYGALTEWIGDGARRETTSQQIVQTYDTTVQRGSLHFESGVGTFTLRDTCSDLLRADVESTIGAYEMNDELQGTDRILTMRLSEGEGRMRGAHVRNNVTIRLHPSPLWDLHFKVGAAKLTLDLGALRVDNLDVESGAAEVRLTLGDRADECRVRVKAGASTVKVRVPESVGCEIRPESALATKHFDGFEKAGDAVYRTRDFDAAVKKIHLSLHAGVSTLRVERY